MLKYGQMGSIGTLLLLAVTTTLISTNFCQFAMTGSKDSKDALYLPRREKEKGDREGDRDSRVSFRQECMLYYTREADYIKGTALAT